MLGDERLELGTQGRMATDRELGLDPLLERQQAKLSEALDLELRERLELEIGQRPATPQRLRLAEKPGRPACVPPLGCLTAIAQQLLENVQVKFAILDAQLIPGARVSSRC